MADHSDDAADHSDAAGPVGRDEVIAQLHRAIDDAVAGPGRLVLLAGEPGIGKTTQLSEAAGHAAARGARVAWGWGSPAEGAPAFWVWTQVLRDLDLTSPAVGMLDQSANQHTDRSTNQPPLQPADEPASARFRLFDEVTSLLLAESRVQPVVVLLDDLQWADQPSLSLLDFLARRLPSGAMTVLGAYRDLAAGPAGVPEMLVKLAGRSTVIPLVGLAPEAVGRVVADILGEAPPAELVSLVHRRTGGNPFFVHQMSWLIMAGGSGVPPGVREALDERLGRLAAIDLEVLSAAAIVGRPVTADLIAEAIGRAMGQVADALANGVHGRILAVDGGRRFRFAHDLFREYADERLIAPDRNRLHARIGHALEVERVRGGPVTLAELATHFARAGSETERTLRYSTAAAEEASGRLAYEEAVRHWERALDAVGEDAGRRTEILHDLALARWRAGDGPGAGQAYQVMRDLARRRGDGTGMARAALGLQRIGSRSLWPAGELVTALSEALDAVAAGDPLRVRVSAALARVLAWSGADIPRAQHLADEAVSAARTAGAGLAEAQLAGHNVAWRPATAPARRAIAAELVALARQAGDRELLVESRLLLASDLLELGDPAFRDELDEFLRLAEATGQPRWRYAALVRRAALALLAGQYGEAGLLMERAAQLGEECGEPGALDVSRSQRWDLHAAQGRLAESMRPAESEESFPASDSRASIGARVLALISAGRHVEASEAVRPLLDSAMPDHQQWTLDLVFSTEIMMALGARERAAGVYDAFAPVAHQTVVDGALVAFKGAIAHYLGLLAMLLGRPDAAKAHFTEAVAIHERLGARPWELRSRYELALLTGADTVGLAQEAAALGLAALAEAGGTFRREGPQWTLAYCGTAVRMRDAKGLGDLATLLAAPGRPVASADLAGRLGGRADLALGADEILDATARAQLKARISDLDEEIEEAQSWSDPERAARARAERDALLAEVSSAMGLAGRTRRLGDQSERARKAVTARIRDVIGRIEQVHPQLGAHLRATVTTGTYCVYAPPTQITWRT